MDRDHETDGARLLQDTHPDEVRTSGDSSDANSVTGECGRSFDSIVFDNKMMKTSTQAEDLAATWGGRRSLPESSNGRLRRVHSWSGGPPDDVSSEIRILRERLVYFNKSSFYSFLKINVYN